MSHDILKFNERVRRKMKKDINGYNFISNKIKRKIGEAKEQEFKNKRIEIEETAKT